MSLQHLLTKTFIQSRLTAISGYKQAFATVTGARGNLQPLSLSKNQLSDGVMGKTFVIYADPTLDVREGDKLRDTATGKYYKVRNGGVTRRTQGSIDFNHIIVEEIT